MDLCFPRTRVPGLACAASVAVAVFAPLDDARAQVPATPSAVESEEIIITARRRDELLEKAPVPVSVVSGEALAQKGITQVQHLNETLPALTVQPTATGNLIFVRGVGNFTLLPNSDPAVGYAYDGVFISRPMGTMSQFFDLDRIELLKGPQGVLYGRNASAGSINVEPRQPVFGEHHGRLHASIASSDDLRGEAAINLPLGRAAAFRLSGASSGHGSFLDGYRDGQLQRSVRAQAKAGIGERITVRLAADYNHMGGTGPGSSYVGNYVYDPGLGDYRFVKSGLPASEGLYSERSQTYRQTIFLGSAGRTLDSIGSRPGQDHIFYGTHARVDAELGFAKLTVLPAWRRALINSTVSSAPFGYRLIERDEQASLETRLAGRTGGLEWLGGMFAFDDRIDSTTITNLSSSLGQSRQRYKTVSKALFGNLTFHVSRSLRLGGGLRWTGDRKRFTSNGETLAIVCQRRVDNRPSCPTVPLFPLTLDFSGLPFAVPEQPGLSLPIVAAGIPTGAIVRRTASVSAGRLVDRALTWRIGAEADVSANTLIYASAESGYRPGGFSSGVGFETYRPERITAYTLGLRHRGMARRLEIDLEAFWWDYRDQQVSSLRPDLSTPPRNANITDNIGKSSIRGIEAELRFRPWHSGRVEAAVQYLDSRYRSFEYINANTGVPPLTGCDATLDAAINRYTVDCSAKQPYNSPRWSLTLGGRQSFKLGGLLLTAAVETHFRTARNIGFAFLDQQRIGPTWTSNAQLIAEPGNGRFEIAAFVRNIEGDRVPQFMIYHPVSNALVAVTSRPRQFGLRLGAKL